MQGALLLNAPWFTDTGRQVYNSCSDLCQHINKRSMQPQCQQSANACAYETHCSLTQHQLEVLRAGKVTMAAGTCVSMSTSVACSCNMNNQPTLAHFSLTQHQLLQDHTLQPYVVIHSHVVTSTRGAQGWQADNGCIDLGQHFDGCSMQLHCDCLAVL